PDTAGAGGTGGCGADSGIGQAGGTGSGGAAIFEELIGCAERWLESQDELTYERKRAVKQARFKIGSQRALSQEVSDKMINENFHLLCQEIGRPQLRPASNPWISDRAVASQGCGKTAGRCELEEGHVSRQHHSLPPPSHPQTDPSRERSLCEVLGSAR